MKHILDFCENSWPTHNTMRICFLPDYWFLPIAVDTIRHSVLPETPSKRIMNFFVKAWLTRYSSEYYSIQFIDICSYQSIGYLKWSGGNTAGNSDFVTAKSPVRSPWKVYPLYIVREHNIFSMRVSVKHLIEIRQQNHWLAHVVIGKRKRGCYFGSWCEPVLPF